jgi:hypothetical protein
MNPNVIAKAVTLPVHENGDGSWRVTGSEGTYSVYRIGADFRCSCPAGHGSTHCSHREAVKMRLDAPARPRTKLDDLTAEMLTSYTLGELGSSLNECVMMILAVAQERQAQNTRMADLKIRLNRYRILDDKVKVDAVKDEIIIQTAIVKNLAVRSSAYKDLRTALQSTIRMAGQ